MRGDVAPGLSICRKWQFVPAVADLGRACLEQEVGYISCRAIGVSILGPDSYRAQFMHSCQYPLAMPAASRQVAAMAGLASGWLGLLSGCLVLLFQE